MRELISTLKMCGISLEKINNLSREEKSHHITTIPTELTIGLTVNIAVVDVFVVVVVVV